MINCVPAYLQLAPLLNRECCGLPPVKQYHGTLTPPRIAPSRPIKDETEVSLYPTSPSWRSAAPHGCLVSLLIARSGWRSWRQKTSRFEKRGKIRSTDYSVVKEPRRRLLFAPSLYNGLFLLIGGVCSKNIFEFFPHGCNSLNNRFVVNPFLPCILTNTYSTEHDNIKYFKLNGTK